MKRSENDSIIEEAIAAASSTASLFQWAGWNPSQFDASAAGVFNQGLAGRSSTSAWVSLLRQGSFCSLCATRSSTKPANRSTKTQRVGNREYPASSFSRNFSLCDRVRQSRTTSIVTKNARKCQCWLAVQWSSELGSGRIGHSTEQARCARSSRRHLKVKADGFVSLSAGDSSPCQVTCSHIIRVPANASHTILLET